MRAERGSAWAWLVLAALPLSSCASRVTLPPLPECHPANAAAPAAERAHPSDLLDSAPPVSAAEPEPMEGHEHHEAHPPPPPPPPRGSAP